MKVCFFLLMLAGSLNCSATTFQVGSTRAYSSPNQLYLAGILQDGDTIDIDAEVYAGTLTLAAWEQNDLLIRGIDGVARMDADSQYIYGKGIWVLIGDNITVENIEFFGASVPDLNGAGIRLDGSGMTVRNCYFHNNDTGILTNNTYDGEILIEYSEFNANGYGDGQSHNLYIGHCNKFTFQFNYSHHAKIGHNLKSRANENHILYNRIMDEESGTSSRLIDLPNGGFAIVMGNLLMQGEGAPNKNMVGYGLEGLLDEVSSEFYFVNNTLVNKKATSGLFFDINAETSIINISNNIYTGPGTIYQGNLTINFDDIIDPNIDNLDFADEPNFDYRINANSVAIDAGIIQQSVNGYSLTPEFVYIHPTSFGARSIDNNIIDAGAYEFQGSTSNNIDVNKVNIIIYPNPVSDVLSVKVDAAQLSSLLIYNSLGERVLSNFFSKSLNLFDLNPGVYFLKIDLVGGHSFCKKIIKE